MKKYFIILDSNSIIHRAFHALPKLTDPNKEVVNAVYGFLSVLFKVIKEFEPKCIVAAFDLSGPTFRDKLYKDYKATRQEAPKELYQQIPKIKDVLKTFNIKIFEKKGFEADDVIGTLANNIEKEGKEIETIILSSDNDILQLVSEKTKVFFLRRGVKDSVIYDEEKVLKKFKGIETPKQIIDYKALRGDPSDNIPGVSGIGEKTALSLIKSYKSLEGVYENLDKLNNSLKEKLLKDKENAFLSKKLAEIKIDIKIDFSYTSCEFGNFPNKEAEAVLKNLGFNSLIKRMPGSIESCAKNLKLW